MDAYSFSLALGAAGLAVMGVSGLAHSHVGHGAIADALSEAKLVTISGGEPGGAAQTATANITSVIQTVLAAQLVTRSGILDAASPSAPPAPAPTTPTPSLPAAFTRQPVRK